MKLPRREFLGTLASAGAMASLPGTSWASKEKAAVFHLNYAPHVDLFENSAGPDLLDQVRYAAGLGFRAWEDNELRNRTPAEQEALGRVLADHDMRMGVFVGAWTDWDAPTLTSDEPAEREKFLAQIRESIDVAKRVGATWMTVVAGHVNLRVPYDFQMTTAVETLKRGAALLEPHGLTMVLEPLNVRDHPGQVVTRAGQAYRICKSVNSPSLKILYDIYHQQTSEGNLIDNIDRCWDEIAYFQIGDNPGRKEPTTGEINYRNLFAHIHGRGYSGILGMEHGKSKEGVAGEEALVAAYRLVDDFPG